MFMTKLAFSLHLPLMQYQLVKCSTFILRPKFHQLILYASLWLPVLSAVHSARTCLFLPRLDSYLEKFGIVSKMKIINSRSTQLSTPLEKEKAMTHPSLIELFRYHMKIPSRDKFKCMYQKKYFFYSPYEIEIILVLQKVACIELITQLHINPFFVSAKKGKKYHEKNAEKHPHFSKWSSSSL